MQSGIKCTFGFGTNLMHATLKVGSYWMICLLNTKGFQMTCFEKGSQQFFFGVESSDWREIKCRKGERVNRTNLMVIFVFN